MVCCPRHTALKHMNQIITELQKAALVFLIEKQGQTPNNYANNLYLLSRKGFIKWTSDPTLPLYVLTDKGNTFYFSI
jgi:hypothetical protein